MSKRNRSSKKTNGYQRPGSSTFSFVPTTNEGKPSADANAKPKSTSANAKPRSTSANAKPRSTSANAKPRSTSANAKPRSTSANAKARPKNASAKTKARSQSPPNAFPSGSRAELADLVTKKLEMAKTMANLERQIYAFEGNYLQDSRLIGNCVRGWDRAQFATGYERPEENPKNNIKKTDRMFSSSSVTCMAIVTGDVD